MELSEIRRKFNRFAITYAEKLKLLDAWAKRPKSIFV